MQRIDLQQYPIYIGEEIWPSFREKIAGLQPSSLTVLCDAHTRIYCLPELLEQLGYPEDCAFSVPAGEKHKTLDTCRLIWKQLMDRKLDRQALLINLGGGVIGDMGGFCAATFKRGIRFIQVPTTLLSQVDASVGGKLGVDFAQVKNSIGLFENPEAVFIHPEFLKTLPERELYSGFAEVIKHALIGDEKQWETIRHWEKPERKALSVLLPDSLRVKKEIVEQDPFERGQRKLLNFGHTIGHAVESHYLESPAPLLHGEAVAIGMVCEAYLSHRVLDFPLQALGDLCALVQRVYGARTIPTAIFPELIRLMQNDKKNRDEKISFSLLYAPGRAIWDQFCSTEAIQESLSFYNNQSLSLFAP